MKILTLMGIYCFAKQLEIILKIILNKHIEGVSEAAQVNNLQNH